MKFINIENLKICVQNDNAISSVIRSIYISNEPYCYHRKISEALEIRRLNTGPDNPKGLNRDHGDYVTTNSWSSTFKKINSLKHTKTFESLTS